MTPFSASPETTLRILRPTVDDDMRRAMRRAMRHARVRRRRRASRLITRRN